MYPNRHFYVLVQATAADLSSISNAIRGYNQELYRSVYVVRTMEVCTCILCIVYVLCQTPVKCLARFSTVAHRQNINQSINNINLFPYRVLLNYKYYSCL